MVPCAVLNEELFLGVESYAQYRAQVRETESPCQQLGDVTIRVLGSMRASEAWAPGTFCLHYTHLIHKVPNKLASPEGVLAEWKLAAHSVLTQPT